MPIGSFLNSLPTALFIGAHIAFLIIGLWTLKRASDAGQRYAPALWLYVASQPVFLGFFAGIVTLKMAVLVEQTLLVGLVIWLASQTRSPAKR